ncbi:hypothetical protein I302_106860 [Kwoniella bestiolae CBS 10118]|uniref:GSKIP domain-containing protein n=1 Tax=Kwoniella bestiolae CBS 10118 TaxID=1296100 RepID=A0A1B9G079_9TREE|nr:hypothetical protein I302_05875 [Kwoniella bestiolae CBS 10118]OCF24415.1 hypothetical protein I302_05875 [Kwoniella bestiolae CBS 10118]
MTSSLPSSNILLNPLPEIRAALKSNSFGISSSRIIEDNSFPITQQDLESVKDEIRSTGMTSPRVVGRADIMLRQGEGMVGVRLDRSGWTVESIQKATPQIHPKLDRTYESLESLLIDLSPSYVKEMNNEIWKRFGMDKNGGDEEENESI